MDKEKQRKRDLGISFEGKGAPSSIVSRLQPRKRVTRGTDECALEEFLSEGHVLLFSEFRKGGCTASPGVAQQFDQITRNMLTSARSMHVAACLIRAELGLPDLT